MKPTQSYQDETGQWWIPQGQSRIRGIETNCAWCSKPFGYYIKNGRGIRNYCSRECSGKARLGTHHIAGRARWEKDAVGVWWLIVPSGARYRGEERTCLVCDKVFPFHHSGKAANKGQYCSRKCANTHEKPRETRKGAAHQSWKGGRRHTSGGYVEIYVDGQYVREHRHVMAQHLGRSLLPKETVHHKNGNKADNRIENLELWMGNHGKDQRWQDVVEDIIKQPEIAALDSETRANVLTAIKRTLGLDI